MVILAQADKFGILDGVWHAINAPIIQHAHSSASAFGGPSLMRPRASIGDRPFVPMVLSAPAGDGGGWEGGWHMWRPTVGPGGRHVRIDTAGPRIRTWVPRRRRPPLVLVRVFAQIRCGFHNLNRAKAQGSTRTYRVCEGWLGQALITQPAKRAMPMELGLMSPSTFP